MHLTFIDKIHFFNVDLSPPLFVDDEVVVGKILKPHLGRPVLIVPALAVVPVLFVVNDRHARLGVGLCYFLTFSGLRCTAHLNYLTLLSINQISE